MADDWQTHFTRAALAKVDAFIAEHPDYSRRGVRQPGQGSTNRVVFAQHQESTVVFKVFCEAERYAREVFGLRHWQSTDLVPELLATSESGIYSQEKLDPGMIVMSHIPGHYLHQARMLEGSDAWRSACRETGSAVGALTQVPLADKDRVAFESQYYDGLGSLDAYLGRILELGRSIATRDPGFAGSFWQQSLDLIASQMGAILAEPRVLYHQDVANLHVHDSVFAGFFDLEMCRVGCASMQLGAVVSSLFTGDDETEGWHAFMAGWQHITGCHLTSQARAAATAACHLLSWREISRYLSYDGTPGSGFSWAEPADPIRYRSVMETAAARFAAR